jgi:biopolymer transport protein TolR
MKANPYSRNRPQKLNASMNVVPYIDVMLVLLVIFMVTAPMLTTGVDIDLPKAQTKSLQQGTQLPVIVSLKSDGQLYLSTQDKTDEPMSEEALIATLINFIVFCGKMVESQCRWNRSKQPERRGN